MDDLKGMFDNADCQQLLAVVPAVKHQGVGQPLNNGALSLPETPGGVSSGSVGQEGLVLLLDGDVILDNNSN